MMNSRPTKKPDAPRGPFKELRSCLARLVASKAFLLLLSVFTAFIAWGALVASDGTLTRQKVFQNVPVNISGEATLKSRGFIVMDDLSELVPGVRLTVEVTQNNYSRVNGTSYNPHFDLSKIKGKGENELTVNFSSQLYGPVIDCEPSSITVNVDRYMTRRVPVVVELKGETPEGVYLDSYRTDPAMLSVSGPQTVVTGVSRAVAKLDLSALTLDRMSDRVALQIQLQDSKGKLVVSDKIEVTNQTVITDAVVVETEVVPAKTVPLLVEDFITGEPAEGYELLGVDVGESEMIVAGKQETIDAIEFLTTEYPMSIDGASASVSGYVRLKRPAGLDNTLPTEVAVTAEIGEKNIERMLRAVDVEIEGLSSGLKASLSTPKMAVQLKGPFGFLKGLGRSDMRLYVDVSGLAAGEHIVPVQIRLNDAPEDTGAIECALSDPEVEVTISEK